MRARCFSLILAGAVLALARPAAALDCSEQGMQNEMNAYQAAQPQVSGMCESAKLQIKLMRKQIEILDQCPSGDPDGDNRWQAQQSIKSSQYTLDHYCTGD